MKNQLPLVAFLAFALTFTACSGNSQSQNGYNLQASEFAEKMNETPDAPLIDVRTPEEFSNGHLKNAVNVDWNGDGFENGISKLKKEEAVFVYCLSGGRSSSAATRMRSMGFAKVYELDGGIMKWRAANLPEESANSSGMTADEFQKLLLSDKKVLIDFYADWCGPCKKMAPYLDEMKSEMANSVIIVRINADTNQALAKELKVNALPTLLLYKDSKVIWSHVGFIEKTDLVKSIETH